MAPSLPPAIFLMGPTASGKTAAAVALAESGRFEIISVDSALVYRDMDIGTSKPDAATLERAPHRLINLIDPTAVYSAAQFRADALAAMAEITAAGRIPLLVGGTMLYYKALREGLSDLPQADPAIRLELEEQARAIGWPAMHAWLAEVDPATAHRLEPTDAQRIQRALEIWRITGQPMSQHLPQRTDPPLPYRLRQLALLPADRSILHQRIATRFDAMLAAGLVDELAALQQKYVLDPALPSMRCVGYRQAWNFLAGHCNAAELREQGIAATRQLAKRQLTWLRSTPDLLALDCLADDLAAQVSAHCLEFAASSP